MPSPSRQRKDETSDYKRCMKKEKKEEGDDGGGLCKRGKCSAKAKYDVYPSAYANGYASQVCHGEKADALGNKRKSVSKRSGGSDDNTSTSDLHRWFEEEWVDACASKQQGKKVPCGRDSAGSENRKYPYCRPSKKQPGTTSQTWKELSDSEIDKMCRAKRAKEAKADGKTKQGGSRKPNRVYIDRVLH